METKFDKALEMSDKQFRRLHGFTKATMIVMVDILLSLCSDITVFFPLIILSLMIIPFLLLLFCYISRVCRGTYCLF